MAIIGKVRLGASIALLCAIFLPLAECSGCVTGASAPTPVETKSSVVARSPSAEDDDRFPWSEYIGLQLRGCIKPCEKREDCYYVYKQLDFSWQSALTLIAFIWPLGFIFAGRFLSGRRFAWLLYLAELLLGLGALFWIFMLIGWAETRYGSGVVLVSILTYLTASFILLTRSIRAAVRRRREKRTGNSS